MGCSCKQNVNTNYTDNKKSETERGMLTKVVTAILQFLFGLLVSVIMIIGLFPLFGYIIFSVCTGRDMHVRIPNFIQWFKK